MNASTPLLNRNFFRRYWPALGWGAFIFILTGMPGQMIPVVPSFLDLFSPDKIVHLFIFGFFVFTLMRGLSKEPLLNLKKAGWYSVLISVALGGITELLQAYVFIDRQGSVYDFIANVVGCLLALAVCRRWSGVMGMEARDRM